MTLKAIDILHERGGDKGFFMMSEYGFGLWAIPMCMVGMGLFVGSLTLMVAGGAGASAKMLIPSGSSTPHEKEYSYAESLVMRGMYEDAVSAFELAVVDEKSTDPTPFLRIARIYRDHLERYEDAARWLNRALSNRAHSTTPARFGSISPALALGGMTYVTTSNPLRRRSVATP